jgi:hypothetical protein
MFVLCRMAAKYTEVSPEDIIWSNLGMNPYEQKVCFDFALIGFIHWITTLMQYYFP